MVVPQGGMRRSRAILPRGSKRRGSAVQTRLRGGCSGGGWPRPSGRESSRWSAIASEAMRNGWNTAADRAVKHLDMQAVMKTHLSQSTDTLAFDGQQGMSLAISSIASIGDISSAITCIEPCTDASATTGRETGASARQAISKTASRRRIARFRITCLNSYSLAALKSRALFHNMGSICPALIDIKAANRDFSPVYLSDRPMTAISSAIFSR